MNFPGHMSVPDSSNTIGIQNNVLLLGSLISFNGSLLLNASTHNYTLLLCNHDNFSNTITVNYFSGGTWSNGANIGGVQVGTNSFTLTAQFNCYITLRTNITYDGVQVNLFGTIIVHGIIDNLSPTNLCYFCDTKILTPTGEVEIENLKMIIFIIKIKKFLK